MISSLSRDLAHVFQLYPIRFIFLLFSLFILFLSFKLYRHKLSTNYKIYYPILNYIAIVIYILYYIIILLVIRFYMFNQKLDLNLFINSIKELHKDQGILFLFLLLNLWILFFVSLVVIRKIFIKEIIKFYISMFFHYGYFKSKYYRLYNCRYIRFNWLRREVVVFCWTLAQYAINLFSKYREQLIEKIGNSTIINSLVIFLLRFVPLLLLFILFFYDLILNHFVISKVFYYLPFYFIYNIWYRVSTFLDGNNRLLNQVIYERYYQLIDIAYLDVTKEEEENLKIYMRNGFRYEYTLLDLEDPIPPILRYRRYVREPNTNEFYNVETGQGTVIEDIVKLYNDSPDVE